MRALKAALGLAVILLSSLDGVAGQVDQNAFARIESGMTESQVMDKLGPPDDTYERCGESRYTRICYLYYVYLSEPDRAQNITTIIRFNNGIVFDKKRITK